MKVRYVDENNLIWGKQLYLYENDGVVVSKDTDDVFFINKGNQIKIADFKEVIIEAYLHNPRTVYFEKFDDEEIRNFDRVGRRARNNIDIINKNDVFMMFNTSNRKVDLIKGFKVEKEHIQDCNLMNYAFNLTRENDRKTFRYHFIVDEVIDPYITFKKTDDIEYKEVASVLKDALEDKTGLELKVREIEKPKILKK